MENKKPAQTVSDAGQTLLFVVVAVTIALAVGVSVSTRTLSLSSRISRTDTSQRVIAAAEGGLERLLTRTDYELEALSSRPIGDGACDSVGVANSTLDGCIVAFEPLEESSDNIVAQADVSVGLFNVNSENGDYYWFNLEPGYVKEVNLDGYNSDSLLLCWDNTDTAVYYTYYNTPNNSCDDIEVSKGGLISSSFSGDVSETGFERVNLSEDDFDVCGYIDLSDVDTPVGLRLRALYDSAKIGVFPDDPENFPDQGYKMLSKGELATGNEVVDVKTIFLYKSFSYAPAFFDYGLYTTDSIQ